MRGRKNGRNSPQAVRPIPKHNQANHPKCATQNKVAHKKITNKK